MNWKKAIKLKTLDGKSIFSMKGIEYVLLSDYTCLMQNRDDLKKYCDWNRIYIDSLKKIIYKVYSNKELSNLEMITVMQANEKYDENIKKML